MKKIGFLGLGVMGLSMALNVSKKIGVEVIGYDVSETQLHRYREMGGTVAASAEELYSTCDVLLQMLPTHAIIQHSVEEAIRLGRPGNIIVDLSSAAPDIILDLNKKAMNAGMFLLDSPVSGGNPMAEAGTLSIMTGGDPQAFEKVSVDTGCKRKLTQNSFMQTGLTMGKGADIFALVSRGHRSDRIPPRESPRRAHGTL